MDNPLDIHIHMDNVDMDGYSIFQVDMDKKIVSILIFNQNQQNIVKKFAHLE